MKVCAEFDWKQSKVTERLECYRGDRECAIGYTVKTRTSFFLVFLLHSHFLLLCQWNTQTSRTCSL